jgi:hypothetical protein
MADALPPNLARVGLCHDAQNDDGKLWEKPELKEQIQQDKMSTVQQAQIG